MIPDEQTPPLNRPAAILAAAAGIGATIASAAMVFGDPRFVFLATGLWALTIVLLPVAMDRDYDGFSPWSFVILTVFIGVTLRGACLSFGFPNPERLDQLYLRGQDSNFFFAPAGWLLAGLLMLSLGFIAWKKGPRHSLLKPFPIHPNRLVALCLVILTLSGAATALYIQRTGGFVSADLSAKRAVIPDLELADSGYQSHGGLRFIASLAIFGHLLLLGALLQPDLKNKKTTLLWLLAIVLLAVACVIPFYASIRTTLAMNLVMSAAMVFYSGKRFRWPVVIAAVAVALGAVYVMTILRPSGRGINPATPTLIRVFEAAVINRNQIELPKTAHILDAIDSGDLAPQFGKTIARWTIAPVPRSLWPNKPVIPPGPEIGRTVYGQRVAGVPPSLVAELFWNFRFPGVIIGAFAIGMGLCWIDSRFRPETRSDLFLTALYVAGPMTMAFEIVGGSIGSGIFRAALHTAVMLGLLVLIRDSSNVGERPATPVLAQSQ